MAMTPLERKAAFKAAVTLREMTMAEAAALLRVSYNHMMLVLAGHRVGSLRLENDIALFVRCDVEELFPTAAREAAKAAQAAHAAESRRRTSQVVHEALNFGERLETQDALRPVLQHPKSDTPIPAA